MLSTIGRSALGLMGALNSIEITVNGTVVVSLPCNDVDYTKLPPITPKNPTGNVYAEVIGPKLEPSTSPVNIDMSGEFYIDSDGLTYYAGLAEFISPKAQTSLLDGSDGLLHLYYQGQDNQFSVAQYLKETARATYYTDWTTSGKPDQLNSKDGSAGVLTFTAHRVGTYMNTTQLTVSASPISDQLCDITVDAGNEVGVEKWTGLPRDINQLTLIWNGAGSVNPDDNGVVDGTTPYFDYTKNCPSVFVPSTVTDTGGYFMFASLRSLPLAIASAEVKAGATADFVSVTITSTKPDHWSGDALITQSWQNVPADIKSITSVFAGQSQSYDYSQVNTAGTHAYGLMTTSGHSNEQVGNISLFVQDSLSDFSLKIENASQSDLCNITICGTKLENVSREQNSCADVLNGTASDYNYPQNYKSDIAPKIFAMTNGLSAYVANMAQATSAGAWAYAGLLRLIYTGQQGDSGNMAPIAKTDASLWQGATFTFNGQENAIVGSRLFGCVAASQPLNGGIGKVLNTSTFTDGKAPLLMQGANGGWMPQTPKFCIETNGAGQANYVDFNIDKMFTPADKLAILSDMTLQSWMNPASAGSSANNRLLTYNVAGNIDHPNEPVQYMAGSLQSSALIFTTSTYVQSSFNFAPPDLTVQIYIKVSQDGTKGKVWTVSQVMGGTSFLSLSLDRYSRPVLDFMNGKANVQGATVPFDQWTCLSATVAQTSPGKVAITLYSGDNAPKSVTADCSLTDKIGTLMVGDNKTGCAMRANGLAFWQRALSASEIQNSVSYGFPNNDFMLGIRWNLTEGSGNAIYNVAASGADYNSKVINPASTSWDKQGAFYVPYMGRNGYVLKSDQILKNWTHVALASSQGYALDLDGTTCGYVSDGSPFKPSDEFGLEAWVNPTQKNAKQIIMEKPGSYSLYINTHGQLNLQVEMSQTPRSYNGVSTNMTFNLAHAIDTGKTSYIAVNFKTGTVENQEGSQGFMQNKYYIDAAIYINGVQVEKKYDDSYINSLNIRSNDSSFFVGASEKKTFNLYGKISNVRVWGRRLSTDEITNTYSFHLPVATTDGLIAGWDFRENQGKTAEDILKNSPLQLTNNQMWAIWQDVSYAYLFVNGRATEVIKISPADVGGYKDIQFTFGGMRDGSTLTLPYKGQIDDVRLFNVRLTEQQIREAMNKPLSGFEDNLAAYWQIDAGSGSYIYDQTGRGNNGTLVPAGNPPSWKSSTAPLQNEAEVVVNVIGGQADNWVASIIGHPSVIEYASSEKDAYDQTFSVMKRGYFYQDIHQQTVLNAGYKVGDLDTVFVGQVQSKPSIVGYIEGGPPLPSENQTLAYWNGVSGNPPNQYSKSCSVQYLESETKTWSFSANETSAFTSAANFKAGYYQKAEAGASAGLGAEANTKFINQEMKIGGKASLSGDIGSGSSVNQSHSNTKALTSILTPSGEWEPSDNILNPVVGRRYIQNNLGMAIVKSATADLYMMALKGTQTPVGYSIVPNKNIPVDTNILEFPINPKYIKNGTLDGKVGLVNDPDYPNANQERGSYFKPVEAYALKRKIEKEEQQIKAFYDNFDKTRYSLLGSLGSVKDKLKENPAFDFSKQLNQRSIVNNYVWSAGGGLRKEELSVANSYSETYTGMSSLKFALGAEFSLKFGTPAGGLYIETDAMFGGSFTMTASKTESSSYGFSLNCTVSPTDYLSAPIMSQDGSGKLKFDGYTDNPAPGKVDTYRYMSFLLSPSEENFTALNMVIDQNWLQNSTSASASAMRQAVSAENGPWRILYRTTYVSRIPAPFQPVKDDTNAPNVTLPVNLPSNNWLILIVDQEVKTPDPSAAEIGAALDAVLGTGPVSNGILNDLIPWWKTFYEAAQVYGSTAFKELSVLREDLLEYMKNKYEAEKYVNK